MFAKDPRVHSRILWHLFILSVIGGLHEYFVTVGPSLLLTTQPPDTDQAQLYSLALTVLILVATGTTRTGPEVFRERNRLYTPSITNKLKEVGEPVGHNVIGSGDSIIGSFLSLSTLTLMRQVSSSEQVDVHELPVVPASMQAEPTTLALKPRMDETSSRFGPIMSLIAEVVRPNRVLYLKGMS